MIKSLRKKRRALFMPPQNAAVNDMLLVFTVSCGSAQHLLSANSHGNTSTRIYFAGVAMVTVVPLGVGACFAAIALTPSTTATSGSIHPLVRIAICTITRDTSRRTRCLRRHVLLG